jgi:hypothetical protein
MKQKNVLFLLLGLFLLNCSSNNDVETQLKNSALIKKHFAGSDLNGLAKMIAFTDSLVSPASKGRGINMAYHHFLDSIYECSLKPDSQFSLPGEKVYPFLLSLDDATFNKIWRVRTKFDSVKINDTILYNPANFMHISFKYSGAFFAFTKGLAAVNKDYESFSELLTVAGDLSPSAWSYYLQENKRFNYNNIDERLWVSLNLLRCTDVTNIETFK